MVVLFSILLAHDIVRLVFLGMLQEEWQIVRLLAFSNE